MCCDQSTRTSFSPMHGPFKAVTHQGVSARFLTIQVLQQSQHTLQFTQTRTNAENKLIKMRAPTKRQYETVAVFPVTDF